VGDERRREKEKRNLQIYMEMRTRSKVFYWGCILLAFRGYLGKEL
jgi:uncharacterized membrane-anchored protein